MCVLPGDRATKPNNSVVTTKPPPRTMRRYWKKKQKFPRIRRVSVVTDLTKMKAQYKTFQTRQFQKLVHFFGMCICGNINDLYFLMRFFANLQKRPDYLGLNSG